MNNRIDKYLSGQPLSDGELDEMTRTMLQVKEDQRLKKRWLSDVKSQGKRKQRHALGWVIISFLLIGGLLYFLYASNKTEDIHQQAIAYLEDSSFPNADLTKAPVSEDVIRIKAMEAYNAKNYKLAIEYYSRLSAEEPLQPRDQFFIGLSYLYDKNYEQSIIEFRALETNKPNQFQFADELNFFLGLNSILIGQDQQAQTYLSSTQSTSWNQELIEKWLEELDSSSK